MEKLEKFVFEDYDGSQYDDLPKVIKRKVDALKNIQLEHIKIQTQYNKRLQELEHEFNKLQEPLYEKRAKIISGEYEPTDQECQLPSHLTENEFNGDQENSNMSENQTVFSEEDEKLFESQVKGIPGFWLGCLSSTYNFSESIEDHDRKVLRYLRDVKLTYDSTDDAVIYKLHFVFDKNPFFTNDVLTKTYYLKSKPDEKNPFSYDGFEVFKSEGCEINWNKDQDVTTHKKKVKQLNKKTGEKRSVDREVERDSFFYFFKPPQMPEGGEDIDEELGAVMAVDFELGELVRQSIIPKAVLYFNGLLLDDDDEMDSVDDDEDDDMLSDSDMEDSDEESTDSLAKKDN